MRLTQFSRIAASLLAISLMCAFGCRSGTSVRPGLPPLTSATTHYQSPGHSNRIQLASASQASLASTTEIPKFNLNPIDLSKASNERNWEPEQEVLPYAEFHDEHLVTVFNVRHNHYRTAEDFDVRYFHRTYDLRKATTVDFIVVPFPVLKPLAHTMISFGFEGGDYLCLSVEIRKEHREKYSAAGGLFRQFEIMYVLGDERDLLYEPAVQNRYDVYVYRTVATPDQTRALLVDVLNRTNQLAGRPEFYHTLWNNCTTNIADHINRLSPRRINYGWRTLLTSYSPNQAYDLGLLVKYGTFAETKRQAWITDRANFYARHPEFSRLVRHE